VGSNNSTEKGLMITRLKDWKIERFEDYQIRRLESAENAGALGAEIKKT